MTREYLDRIKQKQLGEDARALVEEVERCWSVMGKTALQEPFPDEDQEYTRWESGGWFGLSTMGGRFAAYDDDDNSSLGSGTHQQTWRFSTAAERETFVYLQRARQGERRAERKLQRLVSFVEDSLKKRSIRKRIREFLHPEPSVIDKIVAKLDADGPCPPRPPSPAA